MSPSQPIKSAVCLRLNSSGSLTLSISAGTKTPRCTAAAASPLTHSDAMESFDHSTTTLFAVIPETIDFDALWNKALLPVITDLGYDAVRADQDTGASIILEMLERLLSSDLVIADMTVPNGNVYYEIGIRHASRRTGCLLTSADWAKPLFDIHRCVG